MNVLTIAQLSFLEARRRKLFWIVLIVSLVYLALFGVGLYYVNRDIQVDRAGVPVDIGSTFLLIGLYGVAFLSVLLAILVSADTLSGEVASGTIQTIITKPLRRWQVVLGKWLGLALMLTAFVLFMSGGLLATVWAITRYWPTNPVLGIGLIVLEAVVFLTLSILGGTRLPTIGNGVVMFMLYGVSFIAGWVEQIGAFAHIETAVNIGIVTSLVIPGEAMWKRAAYLLQPPFMRELSLTPFSAASAPSEAMVFYVIAYTVVALLVAMWSFQKRDL